MKKIIMLEPTDEVTTWGRVFGTPVVSKGKTWFPFIQMVTWGIMSLVAGRNRPERSWSERLGVGSLTMAAILGSEWCHNLAHAAAARLVGKPMDALLVMWGMPMVIYFNVEDEDVTPRQHIMRALGGPLFNATAAVIAGLVRRSTQPETGAREVMDAAVGMNTFLCTGSLVPVLELDGGPLLKWTLVERGQTPTQANETVQKASRVVGGGLGMATGIALKKRRWFLGAILGVLAALSLISGLGLFKERD